MYCRQNERETILCSIGLSVRDVITRANKVRLLWRDKVFRPHSKFRQLFVELIDATMERLEVCGLTEIDSEEAKCNTENLAGTKSFLRKNIIEQCFWSLKFLIRPLFQMRFEFNRSVFACKLCSFTFKFVRYSFIAVFFAHCNSRLYFDLGSKIEGKPERTEF